MRAHEKRARNAADNAHAHPLDCLAHGRGLSFTLTRTDSVLANVHPLLAFAKKPPPVDVSAHLDEATLVLWLAFGLVCAFFALRPELWRRLWFRRIDPRPVGLMRIAFGISILWTFADLLLVKTELLTDEGLYMTEMARSKFGGRLRNLWDPEHGFEHWYDVFDALWSKFSIMHIRSDPPFVNGLFAALFLSLTLMILGVWTRATTIISWFLANQIYNYSPIFYTGGDTALRTFFFLSMFLRWGEAYSIDGLRRRRKALRSGAAMPALRPIPAWPTYLMMLQLTCIYFATGLLKSGGTWFNGSALYYAMNLDHFYRVPSTGLTAFGHYIGITRLATWITHFWERLFPLALLGVMLRGWEYDRRRGRVELAAASRRWLSYACLALAWAGGAYLAILGVHYYYKPGVGGVRLPQDTLAIVVLCCFLCVPPLAIVGYRALRAKAPRAHDVLLNWLLGKRLWLTLGLVFHAGIDLTLNVGTFVQVMVAPYLAWVTGKDVEQMWRVIYWSPTMPGNAGRPYRHRLNLFGRLADRLAHRVRPPAHRVRYGADPHTIRRVADLRIWDLAKRFEYELDEALAPGVVRVESPSGDTLSRADAVRAIVGASPGLWWARPFVSTGLGQSLVERAMDWPRIHGQTSNP